MPYELLDLPEEKSENQLVTLGKYIGRTGARTVARGLEAAAGLPGDIIGGGVNLLSTLTRGATPTHEQLTQKDIESGVPSWAQLPTSDQARKVTKAVTGEYLEPQSGGEEGWDEVIGDATRLFLGGAKAAASLGASVAGNLAKWGTESVTGSPLAGGVAKLGTTLLAGTFGTRSELNNLRAKSYEDAFAKLPENKRFNFSPEIKKIDAAIKRVSRGSFPDKEEVLGRLNDFKNITRGTGRASVKEVIGIKQGWNEYLREKGRSLAPSAKRDIEEAVGIVNSGIGRFGKTDKAFYVPYMQGEELTAGLKSNEIIGQFINKHPLLRKKMDNPFLGSIFKYGLGSSTGGLIAQYPLQVGGTVGILYGAHQASKALKLMSRSGIARRAYKDAIRNGLAGNVANFSKDLNRLEKEYEKHSDDLEGQYELLD